MDFSGLRVAVAGMGVSGIAAARAVHELGGTALALDEKPNDSPAVISAVDTLERIGIGSVTSWHGRLDPGEFDLLVVSPGFPRDHPSVRDMVGGGRQVWSEVELSWRIAKAPIVAVTGTNGKSTCTVLAWTLINAGGQRAWLCGNIAGSGYDEQTLTEAALSAGPADVLVAEISSFQLEHVHEFRPKVAMVTNVTPDHMDRHPDFDDYFWTKMRVFARMGQGDAVVLNLDEPSLEFDKVAQFVPQEAPIIGFSPSGRETGTGVTQRDGDTLMLGGLELKTENIPLFGEHSVANVMSAWEIAARFVKPSDQMVESLSAFKGLANRMEVLGEREGVLVINSSMTTNPAAVVACSLALKRRQTILVGGSTKRLDLAPIGDHARRHGHVLVVFGPNRDAVVASLGGGWASFETMEEAFMMAVMSSTHGSAVMLAPGCASAAPYANFKERGEAFRAAASAWLGARP